jgi:hypothetical protein
MDSFAESRQRYDINNPMEPAGNTPSPLGGGNVKSRVSMDVMGEMG